MKCAPTQVSQTRTSQIPADCASTQAKAGSEANPAGSQKEVTQTAQLAVQNELGARCANEAQGSTSGASDGLAPGKGPTLAELSAKPAAMQARAESLNAREEKLNAREDKLNAREEKLNAREEKLNAREDKSNARTEEFKGRLEAANEQDAKLDELMVASEKAWGKVEDTLQQLEDSRAAYLESMAEIDRKAAEEIAKIKEAHQNMSLGELVDSVFSDTTP